MSPSKHYANYQTLAPPAASDATLAEGYERKKCEEFVYCHLFPYGTPSVLFSCRLCDGTNLCAVLKLTPTVSYCSIDISCAIFCSGIDNLVTRVVAQPPANAFVSKGTMKQREKVYPLEVNFCRSCSHLQLSYVVSPSVLFRNYVYVSGTSPLMVQHLKDYAMEAVCLAELRKEDFVFEFGSNDGTLLRHFKSLGFDNILGMDPAENIAEVATTSGVPTIPNFFSFESAKEVRNKYGPARLICANHCCAHIDDFYGIVQGVKELLAEDGIWIFEVGYLLHVVKDSLFDTIYHEHVDFHSVEPIRNFCLAQGLRLLSASTNSIQGGSLRCYVGWPETGPMIPGGETAVANLVQAEAAAGLHSESVFLRWVRPNVLQPSIIAVLFLSRNHCIDLSERLKLSIAHEMR